MLLKSLFAASILIAPVSMMAQSPAETHEFVSGHGKSVAHRRAIAQPVQKAGNCHPDASKAMLCEAHARAKHAEALARAEKANTQLSQR